MIKEGDKSRGYITRHGERYFKGGKSQDKGKIRGGIT